MILQILQNSLLFLLIATISLGLSGLFLFSDYFRKIIGLGIAYSGLIILLILLFKISDKSKELFEILITISIIFSITLATGIGIISNIAKLQEKETKNQNSD